MNTILHFLYLLLIAPVEFLMHLVLEWGFAWTHSWGWSLVLLSLVVNTAILPIYNWAERKQEEERKLRRAMARHEAMVRKCFLGQERFALMSALRRLNGYSWRLTLRASVGLLLQIPFFIAAYHLLSDFSPLQRQSFGPLSDLGSPDGLLYFGGSEINLLPFVMTAANLVSAFVYARNLSLRDKVQIYGIALSGPSLSRCLGAGPVLDAEQHVFARKKPCRQAFRALEGFSFLQVPFCAKFREDFCCVRQRSHPRYRRNVRKPGR